MRCDRRPHTVSSTCPSATVTSHQRLHPARFWRFCHGEARSRHNHESNTSELPSTMQHRVTASTPGPRRAAAPTRCARLAAWHSVKAASGLTLCYGVLSATLCAQEARHDVLALSRRHVPVTAWRRRMQRCDTALPRLDRATCLGTGYAPLCHAMLCYAVLCTWARGSRGPSGARRAPAWYRIA